MVNKAISILFGYQVLPVFGELASLRQHVHARPMPHRARLPMIRATVARRHRANPACAFRRGPIGGWETASAEYFGEHFHMMCLDVFNTLYFQPTFKRVAKGRLLV